MSWLGRRWGQFRTSSTQQQQKNDDFREAGISFRQEETVKLRHSIIDYVEGKVADRALDIDYRIREMDWGIAMTNMIWGRGSKNMLWNKIYANWQFGMLLWTHYESQRGIYHGRRYAVIRELRPKIPTDQRSRSEPADMEYDWSEEFSVTTDALAVMMERDFKAGRSGTSATIQFIRTEASKAMVDVSWAAGRAFVPEVAEEAVRINGEAWWLTTGWVTMNWGFDPEDVATQKVLVFHNPQTGMGVLQPKGATTEARTPDLNVKPGDKVQPS